VNEKLFTIVVANKKKLSVYSWQQPNFSLRKEINIQDVPKVLYFVHNSVVVGYKKFYECIDLNTGVISRILDIEKDHKMIVVEVNDFFLSLLLYQHAKQSLDPKIVNST
jgi:hypothetical protein